MFAWLRGIPAFLWALSPHTKAKLFAVLLAVAAAIWLVPAIGSFLATIALFGIFMTSCISLFVWLDSGEPRWARILVAGAIALLIGWDVWMNGSDSYLMGFLQSFFSGASGSRCAYGQPSC